MEGFDSNHRALHDCRATVPRAATQFQDARARRPLLTVASVPYYDPYASPSYQVVWKMVVNVWLEVRAAFFCRYWL